MYFKIDRSMIVVGVFLLIMNHPLVVSILLLLTGNSSTLPLHLFFSSSFSPSFSLPYTCMRVEGNPHHPAIIIIMIKSACMNEAQKD